VVVLLLAFAATVLVAANALGAPRADGPLRSVSSVRVTAPVADGDVVRWDTALPWNPTETEIHLKSVDLVGIRDVEVVGIVASYPTLQPGGVCLSAGNLIGFPPPGRNTEQIDGVALPAAARRTCTNYPTIVVGLRRQSGVPRGGVDAIRVRYEYQGTTYELLLQSSFEAHTP
jgi:hypothetical protein